VQVADQYLLDNMLAAEGTTSGTAKSILREKIGAAALLQRARAHSPWAHGAATNFCQPGYGAAYGRRRDQDERFIRARAQEQEARGGTPVLGGTGHLVACPLAGGAPSWLG
jgi:hypothetical protein